MFPITFTLLLVTSHSVQAALTYKGVDWSSLLLEEEAGITYRNAAGTVQPLQNILSENGINTVRQRLWNNPSDGVYSLEYNLALAQRATTAGLNVYLDLHFSDTWADPAHQSTPSAWKEFDIDDLAWAVYNFTLATMDRFQGAGIPLSLVSIGNEIRAGMLWPLGSFNGDEEEAGGEGGAYNLARLLHSASAGIKASQIVVQPKILIHLDNGWDSAMQEWWYDTLTSAGPLTTEDFDVQGVSYYPFYDSAATLVALRDSLGNMARKYGKEIMIVETNWPIQCTSPGEVFPEDTGQIPFSTEGQGIWMEDVAKIVEATVGGTGVFYWEPAWIDNAGLGSSCDDNLMFDRDGKARSSLAVFGSI